MPLTVSHMALLKHGADEEFRESVYLMVLAFGRLVACREAFGRAMSLTGSQFAVLIGTAYRQRNEGVSIRELADHVQLASTHVTTEVGRLIHKGLLTKRTNTRDRRSVLVRLSKRGEILLTGVAPLVRDINDILFQDISRKDFAVVTRFLETFALNSDQALDYIRRSKHRTAGKAGLGVRRTRKL